MKSSNKWWSHPDKSEISTKPTSMPFSLILEWNAWITEPRRTIVSRVSGTSGLEPKFQEHRRLFLQRINFSVWRCGILKRRWLRLWWYPIRLLWSRIGIFWKSKVCLLTSTTGVSIWLVPYQKKTNPPRTGISLSGNMTGIWETNQYCIDYSGWWISEQRFSAWSKTSSPKHWFTIMSSNSINRFSKGWDFIWIGRSKPSISSWSRSCRQT